jgi:hypothetical protein
VTDLSLHTNNIGDEGAEAVAAALAGTDTDGICDAGGKALSADVAGSKLTVLRLHHNGISEHVKDAIADVLLENDCE